MTAPFAASSPSTPRFGWRVLALAGACAMALAACQPGGGDAQAKEGDAANKQPDAVPVEVAPVARRAVAASYTGTAPLEARAESMVVAKTSGIALEVGIEVGDVADAGLGVSVGVLPQIEPHHRQPEAAQAADHLARAVRLGGRLLHELGGTLRLAPALDQPLGRLAEIGDCGKRLVQFVRQRGSHFAHGGQAAGQLHFFLLNT